MDLTTYWECSCSYTTQDTLLCTLFHPSFLITCLNILITLKRHSWKTLKNLHSLCRSDYFITFIINWKIFMWFFFLFQNRFTYWNSRSCQAHSTKLSSWRLATHHRDWGTLSGFQKAWDHHTVQLRGFPINPRDQVIFLYFYCWNPNVARIF